MTAREWKQIKHFSPNENWGNPYRMDFKLLKRLDALREFASHPIIIHCGYATDGHTENSQHYQGRASDFHIENMSLINQYLAAERFMFTGIGIYDCTTWNNPGLHCDVRFLPVNAPAARWVKIHNLYMPLTGEYLKAIEE